jgi:hypothetical protein
MEKESRVIGQIMVGVKIINIGVSKQ